MKKANKTKKLLRAAAFLFAVVLAGVFYCAGFAGQTFDAEVYDGKQAVGADGQADGGADGQAQAADATAGKAQETDVTGKQAQADGGADGQAQAADATAGKAQATDATGKRAQADGGMQTELSELSGEAAQPTAPDEKVNTSEELASEASEAAQALIYVHVCGAVAEPAVYMLPVGARAFEAVKAAGGLLAEAADAGINLARQLVDGEQLYLYSVEEWAALSDTAQEQLRAVSETAPQTASPTAQENMTATGLLDINTATAAELMTLPGIGEQKAAAILAYREENGGFYDIAELMLVSGIKEAAFSRIQALVTVN